MATKKVLDGDDIFNLVNSIGYGLDNIVKFMQENPFITSINFDFSTAPGQSVEYDENFKIKNPQNLLQLQEEAPDTNRVIIGKKNQSIFDIALMSSGMDNVIKLLKENNIANIATTDLKGKIFNFSVNDVKDRGFYNRFLQIVTGDVVDEKLYYLLQEDGYYLLQEDSFKIVIEA